MEKRDAGELLEKYRNNTATAEERALVEKWYLGLSEREFDRSEEYVNAIGQEIWSNLPLNRINNTSRILHWLPRIAAVFFLTAVAVGSYFHFKSEAPIAQSISTANDIAAGSTNAVLTLADGKKIRLDEAQDGELAQQSGIRITKTEDGKLIYTVMNNDQPSDNRAPQMNQIETPNGGDYQVNLPDGTKVWLNAASSLRFPTQFTNKERKVELTGEAYFEVASNKNLPFRVATDQQVVEVLGTHFNINSYRDEPAVKTTLIEGSVKVVQLNSNKAAYLKPGQQAVLKPDALTIQNDADIAAIVAWKNEEFIFNQDDFRTQMRKIARWYDVEVVYDPSTPDNFNLGGFISRKKNLSVVLKLIESTGKVHFKIQGRRILVTR